MVAAYTVWALWFTALSADRAQDELRRRWTATVGAPSAQAPVATPLPDDSTTNTAPTDQATTAAGGSTAAGETVHPPSSQISTSAGATREHPPDNDALSEPRRATPDTNDAPRAGDPYAVMWFSRSDGSKPPVHGAPLYVVEGVGRQELRSGPGHYPDSDVPGGSGNFAIAGHRTTYGAPFGRLDELQVDDLIHVTDHRGRQWTYEVVNQRIVDPDDTWVLSADPLDTSTGTMTLTTCHPRWSATQRLIMFAQLITTGPG